MAKRKKLTVQLPPTSCTPEMRDRVVGIADKEGISIGELVRDAISLFLSSHDSKSNIKVRKKNERLEGMK